MSGVAYTTGLELDSEHKEIHLSADYISSNPSSQQHAEILGVLCHEMVHCFQWNGAGYAPSGLIEGVADWVRLRAGLIPPHWHREAKGKWDAGYQTTAYFLDWLEEKAGEGSVRKLNELLRRRYDEDKVWKECFGKSVKQLWKDYGESLRER
jgi:hypothetical protein